MKFLHYQVFFFIAIELASCAPNPSVKERPVSHPWTREGAQWPSPAEMVEWAKKELDGDITFPGTIGYSLGNWMSNTVFSRRKLGAVVMVESAEDVQKAILFSAKHGIRPTVKSSGHCYVGRSTAPYSLGINMRRMKKILVNKEDTSSPTGASVEVEPGNQMSDLYRKMDKEGYVVVGGSAQTVQPGGYTTGGGHSPMSRMYGLSVDNTLRFTLVTPQGHIVKMTNKGGFMRKAGEPDWEPYEDEELFWAVRGGGGGSFGVVTSFTYTIHKAPEEGFCGFFSYYPMYHPLFGKVGDKIIEKWNSILQNNLTKNWGGYVIISGAGYSETKVPLPGLKTKFQGHLLFSLLHVGGCEEAEPALDLLYDIYPIYSFVRTSTNYSSFWEYEKNVNDPVGFNTYIINRLIQAKDVRPGSALPDILVASVETKKDVGCTWTVLGGEVATPTMTSSVTPDFRSSLGSLSCGLSWGPEDKDEEFIDEMREYGKKLYTVGKGMYYNEPDYYVEDWKEEFWGSMERYNRLLEVKKKYDPQHLFTCHKCVASDLNY